VVGRGTFVETSYCCFELGLPILPALEDSVQVETSLDGIEWTPLTILLLANHPAGELPDEVATPDDTAAGDLPDVDLPDGDVLHSARYATYVFDIDGEGTPFRFIRWRMPQSPLGGLSGYVDHTVALVFTVTDLGPAPAPTLAPGTRDLSCASDVLEDVFPQRPCSFGGVNHFEAASFYHTYFVERADLTRIRGEAAYVGYRPLQVVVNHAHASLPFVHGVVQTSTDGRSWTTVHTFPVIEAGLPTAFDTGPIDLDDVRFVRLTSTPHRNWQASNVTLEGDLPAT
jgi:hypothetical protein